MPGLKIRLIAMILTGTVAAKAQVAQYKFKRELDGVHQHWHVLQLPDELYKYAASDFNDLRIFGTGGKDTVEVPYLIRERTDKITAAETDFRLINQSADGNVFFFTFQSLKASIINQIILQFKEQNFDWKVKLEGSNDHMHWFSILDNYRILSIRNRYTGYQFTRLDFPDSQYEYFRLAVKSKEQPELRSAKVLRMDTVPGISRVIAARSVKISNDAAAKETLVEIGLPGLLPVSALTVNVQNSFDFYRALRVEYATDSFATAKGLQYNYHTLFEGTLTSFEKPGFRFPNTVAARLRVVIQNDDNPPLHIDSVLLSGNISELVARFDHPGYSYALYYGNPDVAAPAYEIEKFESRIPDRPDHITAGREQRNPHFATSTDRPLFENKAWLWGIMGLIIVILGWFSFRMLKT